MKVRCLFLLGCMAFLFGCGGGEQPEEPGTQPPTQPPAQPPIQPPTQPPDPQIGTLVPILDPGNWPREARPVCRETQTSGTRLRNVERTSQVQLHSSPPRAVVVFFANELKADALVSDLAGAAEKIYHQANNNFAVIIPGLRGDALEQRVFGDPALSDIYTGNRAEKFICKAGRIPDGRKICPVFKADVTPQAANEHGIQHVQDSGGRNLSGAGVTVLVRDQGRALQTHGALNGKITLIGNSNTAASNHATHVMGTVLGRRIFNNNNREIATGMAPQAMGISRDFNDALGPLSTTDLQSGAITSNHSYGWAVGWEWSRAPQPSTQCVQQRVGYWCNLGNPEIFGSYDSFAERMDVFITQHPQASIVAATGNDRNNGPQGFVGDGDQYPASCGGGDFGLVNSLAAGKNILGVGSTRDIPRGTVSLFSNSGPTDDGRIKPDVVANGDELRAPYVTHNRFCSTVNNSHYCFAAGTSMATPVVTGGIALLQQLAMSTHGRLLNFDELKAAIITSARRVNGAGPDYYLGFGSLDIHDAACIVARDNGSTLTRLALHSEYTELSLRAVPDNCRRGDDDRGRREVTVAWLDLAGMGLQHDIDVRLVAPNGEVFYPWRLNPRRPSDPATLGVNAADPHEKISLPYSAEDSGVWKLQIRASGTIAREGKEIAVAGIGFSLH